MSFPLELVGVCPNGNNPFVSFEPEVALWQPDELPTMLNITPCMPAAKSVPIISKEIPIYIFKNLRPKMCSTEPIMLIILYATIESLSA